MSSPKGAFRESVGGSRTAADDSPKGHTAERELRDHECAPLPRGRLLSASRSPVSKLPVELMTYVFWFDFQGYPMYRRNLLSRVCRTWRSIIVQDPTIWTTVDLARPNEARECISRSMTRPLDVRLLAQSARRYSPAHEKAVLSSLEDVLYQAERIESFSVALSLENLARVLSLPVMRSVNPQFTVLHTLHVRIIPSAKDVNACPSVEGLFTKIRGVSPLRTLGLTSCNSNYVQPLYNDLQKLSIQAVSMTSLDLRFLTLGVRALMHLELDTEGVSISEHERGILYLQHLETLCLRGSLLRIGFMNIWIKRPPTTILRIHLREADTGHAAIARLVDLHLLRNIHADETWAVTYSGDAHGHHRLAIEPSHCKTGSFCMEVDSGKAEMPSCFVRLTLELDKTILRQISSLTLLKDCGREADAISNFGQIYTNLRYLQEVRVGKSATTCFLKMLCLLPSPHSYASVINLAERLPQDVVINGLADATAPALRGLQLNYPGENGA